MPSTERLFTVKIPVKIKDNPNSGVKGITTLTVKGIGKTLQLRVEPTALTLPPTMPHADVVTADFQLVNPTDYPIEVYSVEFDGQWFAEEEMLRGSEEYVDDVMVLPPRAPGENLWEEVVTAHAARLEAAEAAAAAELAAREAAEAEAERLAALAAEGGGEEGGEAAPAEAPAEAEAPPGTAGSKEGGGPGVEGGEGEGEAGEVGELESIAGPPVERLQVVLVGAPMSGAAAQGGLVAEAFELALLDVEEVLHQFQADRLAAAVAERAAAAAEAAAAAAEAAEAAGEAAPVPEPPMAEEEPPALPPLDIEAVREAIAAVTARDVAPRGFVLVLPEVPL